MSISQCDTLMLLFIQELIHEASLTIKGCNTKKAANTARTRPLHEHQSHDGGSLRDLQAFSWLRVVPAPKQSPRTQTVRRLSTKGIIYGRAYCNTFKFKRI
jgi:hypothetical protein